MLACPPVDVPSTITSLSGPLLPIPSPRILYALSFSLSSSVTLDAQSKMTDSLAAASRKMHRHRTRTQLNNLRTPPLARALRAFTAVGVSSIDMYNNDVGKRFMK